MVLSKASNPNPVVFKAKKVIFQTLGWNNGSDVKESLLHVENEIPKSEVYNILYLI